MMNKTCKSCGLLKEVRDFSRAPKNRDGLRSSCKPCVVKANRDYWRTELGRLSQIWAAQHVAAKARGHKPPAYTKQELKSWAYSSGYQTLFASWAFSGFCKELTPSVDRICTETSYTLDNIRLVTWRANNDAQYTGRKNCTVVTKQNRAVRQLTLDGELVAVYKSIAAAARATGAVRTNINCMCSGTNPAIKSVGGFLWEYA